MDSGCGLGFTSEELVLVRVALEAGVVGVVVLGLALMTKLLRQWLDWRR